MPTATEPADVCGIQVECSVLPQLGAKKRESVRGASGPITVQVPLSICAQETEFGFGTSSSVYMDGQAALGPGAGPSSGPTSPMLTANGTHSGAVSPNSVTSSEVVLQLSGRGSRRGSGKRRKRAAEGTLEAGKTEQAGASGTGRASKQHKPDLQLLQNDLLRWVPGCHEAIHSSLPSIACP